MDYSDENSAATRAYEQVESSFRELHNFVVSEFKALEEFKASLDNSIKGIRDDVSRIEKHLLSFCGKITRDAADATENRKELAFSDEKQRKFDVKQINDYWKFEEISHKGKRWFTQGITKIFAHCYGNPQMKEIIAFGKEYFHPFLKKEKVDFEQCLQKWFIPENPRQALSCNLAIFFTSTDEEKVLCKASDVFDIYLQACGMFE